MEPFYDSEEEIAWGPQSLREIKADLNRPSQKVHKRHTIVVNVKEDMMNCSDGLSKLNISNHSSEYYTANETANTEAVLSSNNTFLKKAINEDNPRSSIPQQTLLDNILQKTLVDNTIILSSSDDDYEYETIEIKKEIKLEYHQYNDDTFRTAQEEVIVLDDSDDEECLTDDEDYNNIECKEISSINAENVLNYEHSLSTSDYEKDSFSESDLHNRKSSPFKVPKIDIDQFDESDDFDRFNDTLEEMERALQHGLDYKMPDDDEKENIDIAETTQQFKKESIISGSFMSNNVINDIEPRKENFKMPHIPATNKLKLKYKDIVSPVRIYINNTTTCLKKNVIAEKNIPKPWINSEPCKNKKLFPVLEFPEVVYKPARQTVKSSAKQTKLPGSIKKFVPESIILKHKERYYNNNLNKMAIHQKLMDGNLTTVEDSFINTTNNFDLSVQVSKQGFIM